MLNALLLPPLNLFLVAGAGLLAARRWRRAGLAVAGAAAALLVLLSTPLVGTLLLRGLERWGALDPSRLDPAAGAIVVLGADLRPGAEEYGGATVGALTLERLRYGALLQRDTGIPILCTGGTLRPGTRPLARLMADVLTGELGARVRWVEAGARNTFENARLSRDILAPEGITRVFLVTHAWHMPRAEGCFARVGFEPIPAPTGHHVRPRPELGDLLPSAKGLRQSSLALHEWLGLLWYGVRHRG